MWRPEEVRAALRARGELWDASPGLTGMRGDLLKLARQIGDRLRNLALVETDDEWCVPAGISMQTLERAQYFASFPQWLTGASHLSGDEDVLRSIACADSPAAAASNSMLPVRAALSPAVCYHTYSTLAVRTIPSPHLMTAEGVCWRHEGDRLAQLERGWAFTMREIVCLGTDEDCESFRQRGMTRATGFAESLGLSVEVVEATDPFFAPVARGRALLQRVKALKHELVVRLPDGKPLAIASFNNHERFFGEAFCISLRDASFASSACVAFGLERWLLAILMAHGPDLQKSSSLHSMEDTLIPEHRW